MNDKDIFSYDQAKKRLQKIQKDIESGKMDLDELESALKEANELISQALKKLGDTETILKKLENDE